MKRSLLGLPMLALGFFGVAVAGLILRTVGLDLGVDAFDLRHELEPPNAAHWLGTAEDGVDLALALFIGAQYSASIALPTVFFSYAVGALLGTWAGLVGRRVDIAVTGAADLLQSFPSIILHVAILALVAEPSRVLLIVALSTTAWILPARIARAEASRLRDRDFVAAARALGLPMPRVLLRHVLPNLSAPIIVQASSAVGHVILAEATLSFLGVSATGAPSWGALIEQGAHVMLVRPHVLLITTAVLASTLLGFHALGDRLRDRLIVGSRA